MPNEPIQLPGEAPAAPAQVPWWVTTVVGVLVPVALVLSQYLDEPWRGLVIGMAGAVGAALGVSHSGAMQWRPR